MKNQLLFMSAMMGISATSFAQSIETPANTALTIASDIAMPSARAIRVDGNPFIRLNTQASGNVAMGFGTGQGGTLNTFIGNSTGGSTTGLANVFIGSQAGFSNTGGTGNLFMGQQAGFLNQGGSYNLFLGNGAGGGNISGTGNTAIGDGAANSPAGDNNVYIGRYAGFYNTGTQNVFIGQAAGVPNGSGALTNAIAIGQGATITQSNAMVLGNASVNVGIGTGAPSTKLHVVSAAANTSGLRLQNLTNASPATVLGATKFLSVDASGNVVLASLNALPRVATSSDAVTTATAESYWQLAGGRLSNSSGEAVVIGKGISKLGGNYGLYVEKGILTEKVKVAVKNTSDWSDYVFAPEYKLRKLSEVEAFINAHGHLPGVPSAEQVVAEGVDMAKMDATLLQKIEELTLYMVDMKKEVTNLRQQNVKLQQKNNKIERQIKQMRQSSK